VLKEDDTLSPETTSKEDEDGTGLEARPRLSRVDRLANLLKTCC